MGQICEEHEEKTYSFILGKPVHSKDLFRFTMWKEKGFNGRCRSNIPAIWAPPRWTQVCPPPWKTNSRYESPSALMGPARIWWLSAHLYVQQACMRSYISDGQLTGASIRCPLSIICITSFPFIPCQHQRRPNHRENHQRNMACLQTFTLTQYPVNSTKLLLLGDVRENLLHTWDTCWQTCSYVTRDKDYSGCFVVKCLMCSS